MRQHVPLCAFALILSSVSVNGLATKVDRAPGMGFGGATVKKNYTPDTSPEAAALQSLLESHKRSIIDNVEIGFDKETNRRGLYATKTFGKEDAVICKVPSDLALALTDPNDVESTTTMAQRGLNFLSMYHDKRKGAWFEPYLNMLPQAVTETTPSMWEDDDIDLLEFPRLTKLSKERRDELRAAAKENGVSIADLEYATWIVTSRAFPIRLSRDDSDETEQFDDLGRVIAKVSNTNYVPVLVPLLDMANHHSAQPNAKLTLIDPEKDEAFFALTSLRPIKEGKEILIGYGSGVDSSVELLLNHGFVPSHSNPIDRYMLEKGGEDCIESLDGWTTTREEDKSLLSMLSSEDQGDTSTLEKIMSFRIRLKESYA